MHQPFSHPPRKEKASRREKSSVAASARAQAHRLLAQVLGDRLTVDEAVLKHPLVGADADQRFAMLLLMTVLQHLGQIDAVLAALLTKPLPAKRLSVHHALRLGVAQLLLLDTPAHAAVNETVALLKHGKDAGLAGMVNAVLQKISREKPALPHVTHNLPAWLRTRWQQRYGADAVAVMARVASQRAAMDIHVLDANLFSLTSEEGTHRLDARMLRLAPHHPAVETLPGYDEGAFFVQDIAASYPVRMLGDVKDLQVLDLCAAPGGKAMQLIAAGGFVTALDRSAARMKRMKENLKRMRMQANTIVADALEWQPSRAYDAILLDAPCTATGTWRRHPEVVWNVTHEDMEEMVALQRALLARAWAWVKPGGKLLYCVCSLEPEEGEAQATWFATAHADAFCLPMLAESGIPTECWQSDYLRSLPSHKAEIGGMDGFFAVCFEKQG